MENDFLITQKGKENKKQANTKLPRAAVATDLPLSENLVT